MVSAQASPIQRIHQILLWDWQSFYWASKSKKPSYYCPVMNHSRIFKCGTVLIKAHPITNGFHVLPLNSSSWHYPMEVQVIGHTVSVVFMHHCTLPSAAGIQDLGIKGRRHRKQAHTLQQELTVNRNPLSPHREVFIKDAKIKVPFSLVLNTSCPWHLLQKHSYKLRNAEEKQHDGSL